VRTCRSLAVILVVLLGGLLLVPASVAGAAPSAIASVDRTSVALDETVTLSLTITGTDQAVAPSLSNLRGFGVISTGESHQVSMMGGGTSSETVFEYVLQPTATGTKTIPSIEVRAGGQVLRTNPITIEVTAAGGGATAAPPTLPMPSVPPSTEGNADDVFVRCTVDKKGAYVGEEILLTFSLYCATSLGSADYEPAGTEGFRTQPLSAPPDRYEIVNGRRYVVKQDLKLLFPTAPGTHTITPAKVQYTSSFWDPVPKTLASDPLVIQVQRLPADGKPPSFTGVVGHLSVRAHLDRATIRMGEAATLTAVVTGWGNLDAMEMPHLALPAGLRQYHASEHRQFEPRPVGEGYRLEGEALFDSVIIPTTLGDLAVPPIEVAYFDPQARRYEVARSESVVLHVEPGNGEGVPSAPEAVQGVPLRPLPDGLVPCAPGRLVSGPVVVSQLVALGWLLLAAYAYRRRSILAAHPRLALTRTAARRANRLIGAARALPPREGAAQVAAALAGYLAAKLDVPAATVSPSAATGRPGAPPRR